MKRYIRSALASDYSGLLDEHDIYWYEKLLQDDSYETRESSENEVIDELTGLGNILIHIFVSYTDKTQTQTVLYAATSEELPTSVLHKLHLVRVAGVDQDTWARESELSIAGEAADDFFNGRGHYRHPSWQSSSTLSAFSNSSFTDNFDRDAVVFTIQQALGVPKSIASIIYKWYQDENAFDDFETLDEFADYLTDDIYDMIDACDDERIRQRVLNAVKQ